MNDIGVISLANGGITLVSIEDFEELNKEIWFRTSTGYAYRQWNRNGTIYRDWVHRRVNRTPSSLQCDHINQCKFDNRRSNLRRSNKQLDSLNRHSKGVSLHKSTGLWRARVGGTVCKYFKTEQEARVGYERIKAEEVARISAELALVKDDYAPVEVPPKKGRKSIPMIRDECVQGDIAIIPLLRGGHAIIDADMFDELSKIPWRRADSNHVAAWVDCKYVYMHRMIHKTAEGVETDHINRNPLDNRRCNLRDSNESQNHANISKYKGEYHSEFKGVTWHKGQEKWMVTIVVNRKHNHLGYFRSEIEAMSTYNKAALEAFGEFACLNVLS